MWRDSRMRRRTVLAGLPLALAGWPHAVRAQGQAHVAALWPFVEGDPEGRVLAEAFHAASEAEEPAPALWQAVGEGAKAVEEAERSLWTSLA